jgi:hypothetical protein
MLAYPEHSRTVIAKKGIVPDERLPFGPAPKFTAVRFRPQPVSADSAKLPFATYVQVSE